jgi:hypothetical protein
MNVIVDGTTISAHSGQTVAAVLHGLGQTSWRTTRRAARPRGIFCGIGICFDCLIVVNGLPDVRACQRLVVDGDVIATQYGVRLPDGAEVDR